MTGRKKKSDAFKIYPKNSVVEEPIMNEEKKIKKTRKKKETVEKIDTVEFIQNGKITEFIPSKYQNDIWDFVKHGVGNAVVEANAGCAKTSTIVNAIRLIPESLKILFVAFNRDIVKELESKIRAFESENVEIKTLHSLGYSLLRRNFKEINFQLDEYKYRTFIKHNIKELTPIDLTEFSKSDYNSYIDNITTLTDLARYNLAQSEKELSVISDRHGIIPLKDEMTVVLKILEWGKENIDTIDYTDMVWLPYELNLKPLGLTYDWIFIDECQDLNVAQRELFLRCFKKGTRFVAVGDKNQCQPIGTKVLMSDGTEKNIEDIKIGDKVVSYDSHMKGEFYGYYPNETLYNRYEKHAAEVLKVHKRTDFVKLLTINAGEFSSTYTHNHICIAKFNENVNTAYGLYLMKKENQFRIGIHPIFAKNKTYFSIGHRAKVEGAECAWLLEIYESRDEAYLNEQINSFKYGIPQTRFTEKTSANKQNMINAIWKGVLENNNLVEKANELLQAFRKDINCPIWVNSDTSYISREALRPYHACNIFPKYMDFGIFDESFFTKKRKKIRIVQIDNISFQEKEETVVSLSISKEKVYVADRILTHNCIYSFAGADKESFDKIKSIPNTISLPLSISYRCPKKVIKLAQTFVPSIQARDNAPEGSIEYNKSIQDVQSGDMVLCRNKMPLVTVYMRYLRMGKKAFIRGKDIGLNLIKMLDKTEQSILNQDMKSDGVFVRLYDALFEARNQLMLKRGLDLEDATLSETILTMYDNIKALETMSEGLSNVTQLKMRINNVFAENSDGICLSTVHKAKGLEADNVYILCKSLMPSRNAKQDWELEQELNLQYVAYTRAKNTLAFISEKEISPMAGLIDTSVVKTELSYIETVVNKILGKKTDSMMDEESFLKMKIKDATVIEEPKVNVKTLDSPSNNSDDEEEDYQEIINLLKKKGGLKKLKEFLVK
jgi:superfamily I DNA/RNA helicase